MDSVRDILGGKSLEEKVAWMEENPPKGLKLGEKAGKDPSETCERCGGFVHDEAPGEGKHCRCDSRLRRCRELVEAADPGGRMTFENMDGGHPTQLRAAKLARAVALDEWQGLGMFGTPGTGKTHTAVAAVRLALSQGVEAGFYNVVEFVARVQDTYSGEGSRSAILESVGKREMVVLDDLGKEHRSPNVESIVYELVDKLYRAKRRLVVCSNLTPDAYAERYDDAVRSRIAGMCEFVAVKGQDRRRA